MFRVCEGVCDVRPRLRFSLSLRARRSVWKHGRPPGAAHQVTFTITTRDVPGEELVGTTFKRCRGL